MLTKAARLGRTWFRWSKRCSGPPQTPICLPSTTFRLSLDLQSSRKNSEARVAKDQRSMLRLIDSLV